MPGEVLLLGNGCRLTHDLRELIILTFNFFVVALKSRPFKIRFLKFAPLVSGIGSLYVARKVAGNGHRDDERGADPEWAPEI